MFWRFGGQPEGDRRRTRPWSRQRIISEARKALLYALVLTVGLAAAWSANPNIRDTGLVVMLVGAVGLAGRLWQFWLQWQEAQAAQAAAGRRAALQKRRRERAERERARRQAQQEARAQAALRLEQARAAQRQEALVSSQAETARRARREKGIDADVARLRKLPDVVLVAEVAALFDRRGLEPQIPDPEAGCDLLLTNAAEGIREVARCVPAGRIAGAMDVQALEAWRQDAGARHAYLIALSGFSPAAVRLVHDLPLTLVEAYLLAQWRQNAVETEQQTSASLPIPPS